MVVKFEANPDILQGTYLGIFLRSEVAPNSNNWLLDSKYGETCSGLLLRTRGLKVFHYRFVCLKKDKTQFHPKILY